GSNIPHNHCCIPAPVGAGCHFRSQTAGHPSNWSRPNIPRGSVAGAEPVPVPAGATGAGRAAIGVAPGTGARAGGLCGALAGALGTVSFGAAPVFESGAKNSATNGSTSGAGAGPGAGATAPVAVAGGAATVPASGAASAVPVAPPAV